MSYALSHEYSLYYVQLYSNLQKYCCNCVTNNSLIDFENMFFHV